MFNWIKRQRSSRGFGIHSPFAYDFVINVLRERCLYYAYSNIEGHDNRLIYRIALHLHPSEVCCGGMIYDFKNDIPVCDSRSDRFPFYIISKSAGLSSFTLISPQYVAVFIGIDNDKELKDRFEDMKNDLHGYGMAFYNPHRAVIVADKNLPRQDFRINF